MTLDSNYFSLSSGLAAAWLGNSTLTPQQKDLVVSAIPGLSPTDYPRSEEELDTLQVAMVAADFLRSFETDRVRWLSDTSRDIPHAFRQYVHAVGAYFHRHGKMLPNEFVLPLVEFVKNTKSHVAVLNYDNLLYDAFIQEEVVHGFDGTLLDGFLSNGFDKKNLDRYSELKHGWYLHLHGSPLFVDDKKLTGQERINLKKLEPTERSHIVLTHVEHKPLIIESSNILREYWKYFGTALDESQKIVLFGYSGSDTHLNEALQRRCRGKRICVVERKCNRALSDRIGYWRTKLEGCDNPTVHQRDSILTFTDWNNL